MKTQPVNNHNILWADDDVDDLMIMREALESFDLKHSVIEVHNGQEVLDYLANIKHPYLYPCLIILDMNMPFLDGRETLTSLKNNKNYRSIPVVMLTTSSSEMDRMFCKRYGVEMFTKPDNFKQYKDAIEELLSFCSYDS
jgi:CheY-like chemotaxis protein